MQYSPHGAGVLKEDPCLSNLAMLQESAEIDIASSLTSDEPCVLAILRSALKRLSRPEVVVELIVKFPALAGIEAVANLVGFLQPQMVSQ